MGPRVALLSAPLLLAVACGANGSGGHPYDGGPPPDAGVLGPENTLARCHDGIDNDGNGTVDCADPGCAWLVSCGGSGDAGEPDAGFSVCETSREPAAPGANSVDVVWVIDSSGSMLSEAHIVQDNLNDFASTIAASGTDYHVIVLTSPSYVTVPPPLGTDASHYLFVGQPVGSNQALQVLLDRFPDYSGFLRPTATTAFVVVTDDESALAADAFQSQMEALLGHSFELSAIVSPPGSMHCMAAPGGDVCNPGCSGPNGDAVANGAIYWQLAMTTGGVQASICTMDWSSVFSSIAASVAMPTALSCNLTLPAPPDGSSLDPTKVNVVFTPVSGGGSEVIPYVGTATGAMCGSGGWYYDDPSMPTMIDLCPSTCSRVARDSAGRIDISFGCQTVLM